MLKLEVMTEARVLVYFHGFHFVLTFPSCMFYGNGYYVWPGTISLPCTVKPKPIEVLMEATFMNVRVDGIK